jgi:hypothetical protein
MIATFISISIEQFHNCPSYPLRPNIQWFCDTAFRLYEETVKNAQIALGHPLATLLIAKKEPFAKNSGGSGQKFQVLVGLSARDKAHESIPTKPSPSR